MLPDANLVTPAPRKCLQAADEVDFGEDAILRIRLSVDLGEIGIVAAQDVAERRAGQAFDLGEAVENAGGRWCDRRLDEIVDVEESTVTPNRSNL